MAIEGIEVMSVPVSDQDRAKDFYVNRLGFEVVEDAAFGDGMRWVMLRPPGGGTAITLTTWFPSMPAGSLKGTVLRCDDVEKTRAEVTARGVRLSDEGRIREAPWGRWVSFDDPDGNGWSSSRTPAEPPLCVTPPRVAA